MVVKIEIASKLCTCLVCHCDLGLFRRLTKNRFCSDEHEEQYLAELKEVALARLRIAGSRLARQEKVHV